jgi:hypothetical protein
MWWRIQTVESNTVFSLAEEHEKENKRSKENNIF